MAKTAFLLLVALSHLCDAYKILVIFPLAARSHNILGQGYVKALLEAGHEVTYVTPFPTGKTNEKYHEVDLSANNQRFQAFLSSRVNLKAILNKEPELNLLARLPRLFDMVKMSIKNENLERFLNDTTKRFDAVIVEWLFSDVYAGYLAPAERTLYEEYFGPMLVRRGRDLPPYDEVIYNASFLLTNSHTSLSQPISVPPNSREIGGYHIDPNTKPLPADLQKLMDEAKHGVIYFSMGSNAKSKDFPDALKKDFLKVLGEVKQTVIWKFEEELANVPKNVHIVQWAPQQSILAHPNCRLFITHGGLLSTTETVYSGVPTITMPYGADQYLNAIRAVDKGFALKVDLSYEMASDLKVAMAEILSNPKYTERIKELSKIYHERLLPPRKELVHWVEHVVKTRGAPHLRSPALMTPWYQKMYLDLVVVILVALYVCKYAIKKLFVKLKSLVTKETPLAKKTN